MIGTVVAATAFGGFVVYMRAKIKEDIVGQVDDLRSAIGQVGTDLGEAIVRVEAKVVALGEPDPDLSNDIQNLKNFSAQLDALAADQTGSLPIPGEPAPTEPAPDEPAPEEPAPPVDVPADVPTPDVPTGTPDIPSDVPAAPEGDIPAPAEGDASTPTPDENPVPEENPDAPIA